MFEKAFADKKTIANHPSSIVRLHSAMIDPHDSHEDRALYFQKVMYERFPETDPKN